MSVPHTRLLRVARGYVSTSRTVPYAQTRYIRLKTIILLYFVLSIILILRLSGEAVVRSVFSSLPPGACLDLYRTEGSSIPTARRFSSKFADSHALAISATKKRHIACYFVLLGTGRDFKTRLSHARSVLGDHRGHRFYVYPHRRRGFHAT